MNFNFNFENIQFDKKAKPITIGIIAVLVVVFSIISIGLFNNYQADDIEDSKQKAELISMNVSKDLEETVKSISYLSELISSNNLKAKITSDEVTTLLNSLISSDDKIFAAFVLLDKSEYEDLEDLNITNVKELEEEEEIIDDEDEDDEDDEDTDEDDEDEEVLDEDEEDEEEEEPEEVKPSVVNGLNKLIFRSGEGTSETTLDRINNLDYKKNYLKVLLSKEPQTMLPLVNSYNGIEKKTITYTMPIIVDGFVEGVIGLDIDTDKLNTELDDSSNVIGGTYLLLSKDNSVIVSNKPEYIGISVDEVYGSKKLKKFFEESLESMELSSMKSKTASWLEDNLYITVPVVVNGAHIWNLVVKTTVDKTVTNAVVIIFLAIIFNVIAFGLLLLLVYTVFAKGFKKKFNGMLDELDVELKNIKSKKREIYDDINAIEEVDVEEYDDDEDNEIIEQFEATPEEAEEKAKKDAEDDAELNSLVENMDFDKYEEPKQEEQKQEEVPAPPEGVELDGLSLDDVTDMVDASVNETLKNEGVPIVEDDGEAGAPAIEEIIEAEKSEETKPEEEKTEEAKPEEENKEEAKPEAGEEAPKEEDAPELTDEERAAQEAEIKKQQELEADLAEVTENKDGAIDNDSILAEMEAKMAAAMAKEQGGEPSIPIVEEPKIEEPKIEEPKIEEPKIEEPKIEEPKIEEPKIEEPKIEEPKIEEPKIEEPKIEAPKPEPKPEPKPAPEPAARPEPHRPHRIEDPEPLRKRTADDDDYNSIRRGPKKLTNKEMDALLKELEAKRAAEDAENAETTGEFTGETTIDSDLMSDLVGKIKGEDGL